jgi:hypothetical protein
MSPTASYGPEKMCRTLADRHEVSRKFIYYFGGSRHHEVREPCVKRYMHEVFYRNISNLKDELLTFLKFYLWYLGLTQANLVQ